MVRLALSSLRLTLLALALAACQGAGTKASDVRAGDATLEAPRLPTGRRLDPAGAQYDVGQMPLNIALSPDGRNVALLLQGWRETGLQVVDRATGRVRQTIPLPNAFLGLAFAPDGRSLWASGGDDDVVYRFDWRGDSTALADSVILAPLAPDAHGRRFPGGLALSRDGRMLYVAENLADSLAVVDVAGRRVVQRVATGRYPYGVVVAPDGTVYVSNWGGTTVSVFSARAAGLAPRPAIAAGRHPSAMLLSADGSRLFVASGSTDRVRVVNTATRATITELRDPPPAGPDEGTTPNALALSASGTRLFVAEADANAVAVFDLSAASSGIAAARGDDRLAGRVPSGWYPAALLAAGDTLLVGNAKGRGTAPNPDGPTPVRSGKQAALGFPLGQLRGTLGVVAAVRAGSAELTAFSARVARANGWDGSRPRAALPPIRHVIYLVKENRTYDQLLGDLPRGDGDTSLVFFPRAVSPNHHALAERFGVYDRFFANAEVSADGHNWTTSAWASDYVVKTEPSQNAERGRQFDYNGFNRDRMLADDEDDVASPSTGYLWTLAARAGVSFRNFGEFTRPRPANNIADAWRRVDSLATKAALRPVTSPDFPGYDLRVRDQQRADAWLRELQGWVQAGEMPRLQMVVLPNDHTAGALAGRPTPRAFMADNDLALGRMIEALSRTTFWASTAVFVIEDDAQNGADHVDSHRSVFLLVSPWARPGAHHRFVNTTDVVATIEQLLGLGTLSQFDHYGRPLADVWRESPDVRPYASLVPAVSLDESNPASGRGARESRRLDLAEEDAADEALFNAILWRAIKGESLPVPAPRRMSALTARQAH